MEAKFVQAGEVKLQYYQHGHGAEQLVLVHGYVSSGRIWRLTVGHLDPDRFSVFALSNRGAGDSARASGDVPFGEDAYTVENFALDLNNAVEAWGLSGFNLVGHSMGGATVTQYALAHQDKLKSLVLLNSAPLKGRELAPGWDEPVREQFRKGALPGGDMGFQASHITEEFKAFVLKDIGRNPIERALAGRPSMSRLRLRERLNEIKVPTMVVGGDLDDTVGVDNMLADYLALPEEYRSLHIYHGIGHSPNVEVPESLAGLLGRFVGEVGGSADQDESDVVEVTRISTTASATPPTRRCRRALPG